MITSDKGTEQRMAMIRISRPCYDKMHRCPGWAGGGTHFAKKDRCDGGSLAATNLYDKRAWKWRVNRCPKCGIYILPYVIRLLDTGWWRWKALDMWQSISYRRWRRQ
jgi:hypothetical protein